MLSKILFYVLLVLLIAGLIGYFSEPLWIKEDFEDFQEDFEDEEDEDDQSESQPTSTSTSTATPTSTQSPEISTPTAENKVLAKKAEPNIAQMKKLVKQSNIEGVGNIFSPRITIRTGSDDIAQYYAKVNDKDDGYVIDLDLSQKDLGKIMDANTNEEFNSVFELEKNWKKPETNIWDQAKKQADNHFKNAKKIDQERFQTTQDQDPWDTIAENEQSSQEQETKNDLLCYKLIKAQKGVDTPNQDGDTYNKPSNNIPEPNVKYSQKQFHPGYQFVDPKNWDVPQPRAPVCIPQKKALPSAVFDRGLPTNVLELRKDGAIATNEDEITETNVGSILPKFSYKENYYY